MAPVSLLNPQAGEWVCDLCAAPGGKTTQIAGRMQGEGFLLCNEIHPKRAKILSRNIERLGIANALVTNEAPQHLAEKYQGLFDKVLVDAPCSGEGMFRKEEAAVEDWSLETVQMCAKRQLEILESGAMLLRSGGRLVYSTCTFAPEENEQVIEKFLQEHPDFSAEDVSSPYFTSVGQGQFRLWPHKLLGEGHFLAVLRKDGMAEPIRKTERTAILPSLWQSFAKEQKIQLPEGRAVFFGESLYWTPAQMPDIQGVRVLRPGLELGEVKKDRFIPAHALALWLQGANVEQSYPPDSREIERYLHGETVPSKSRGWCLVKAGAYSIGWGKGDGNVLKNHYPKGLRR